MIHSNSEGSHLDSIPVLDLELFQELRESLGNQLEIVAGLYLRFITHTAQTLDELREQPDAIRTATLHAMKGSAAMVGANRIAAIAAELQESLLNESSPVVARAIDALAGELTEFRHVLTTHFDSLGFRLTP